MQLRLKLDMEHQLNFTLLLHLLDEKYLHRKEIAGVLQRKNLLNLLKIIEFGLEKTVVMFHGKKNFFLNQKIQG